MAMEKEKISKTIPCFIADNGLSQPIHPCISYPAGICVGNMTYISWQTLDPCIISYDHMTDEWSDIIRIGTNPLLNDDHGPPALLRDGLGYIHAFYGCHAGFILHARTANPDDITVWIDKGKIGDEKSTYMKPVKDGDGNLYIFFRANGAVSGGEFSYIKSINNGNSWSPIVELLDFDPGHATGYGSMELETGLSDKIHYVWCMIDYTISPKKRLHVYHAYLNLSDSTMHSMDGTNLGGRISETAANEKCRILDSGLGETNLPVIHLYNGIPYIIFNHEDDGWKFKFVKWNGSDWEDPETITVSGHFQNHADFIVNNNSSIEAYLNTDQKGNRIHRGGDVQRWDWNGNEWLLVDVVLREVGLNPLGNIQVVKDYNNEIKIIFAETKANEYATHLKIFAYGDNGFVCKKEEN